LSRANSDSKSKRSCAATFILKTSSNDVHKIVSPDGEHLEAMQRALEEAFDRRT
jgi:hypothetical protein